MMGAFVKCGGLFRIINRAYASRCAERQDKKESSFSEEKEAKRLLLLWAGGVIRPAPRPGVIKVFWFFFSKKNFLLSYD
jgi:hypothetical protein